MKKLLKVVALIAVIGIIGVLILGAVVFAQGPARDGNPNGDNYGQNFGRGWMHNPEFALDNYGAGPMMRRGGYGMVGPMGGFMADQGYHNEMHAAMAGVLGLTVEELDAAMAEGKTMFDIAAEQGVEWADVWAAMDAARQAAVSQAVEDGTLSQEQADWMGQRGRGRGGMMRGGFGQCGGYFQQGTVQ